MRGVATVVMAVFLFGSAASHAAGPSPERMTAWSEAAAADALPPERALWPGEAPARVADSCCKHCSKGKPCGNSCIASDKACRQPPGCACATDGVDDPMAVRP